MAEESRFREQIPDVDEVSSIDQHVLSQVLTGALDSVPEHQDAAPLRRESSEPAQQSQLPARPFTEPVDGQTSPANTSPSGLVKGCETCGNLFVTRSPSEHDAISEAPSDNTSPTHPQAQASTSDENVPPTKSKHIEFAKEIDNRKELSSTETPQTRHAAAVERVNRANTALEKAHTESIDARVALRLAQANTDNTHPGSDDQALKDAQSAVSSADEAYQKCQSEIIQAHIAQSKAESDARLASSVAQQSTSQSDAVQGKETWKGKGRAEESGSSSTDQEEEKSKGKGTVERSESPSAEGKKTRSPWKIVERALRRGSSNEQKPRRSQSEPTLQSPNPSHMAHVPKPDPPVKGKLGWRFGLTHASTTSGPSGNNAGGAQISTAGSSAMTNLDGAGHGNASSSQPVNTNNAENGTDDPQSPGNSQNVKSQGTQTLPAGETGKKPGIARKMSSDLFSKLKKK
ncbi:hypothetical protein KCU95_g14167, partial [Aureobasidium melanogenum]